MIRNSFIILPHVGITKEKRLWQQGISGWDAFLRSQKVKGLSNRQKARHDRSLETAAEHLFAANTSYFSQCLPRAEHWRLYDLFKDEAVYLDIETSLAGDITIVGLFDGFETKTMVKGINLDAKSLREHLRQYKLILTFNGSSFDLPILNRYYPGCIPQLPHIDLRHACARIGLSGGLKKIEKDIGIKRDEEVVSVVGNDAPFLWRYWKATGNEDYLRLLIKYNDEDTINLKPLAEHAVSHLKEALSESYKYLPS
ncbi:MAG: ribonuclease H-like domain-containing protein [Nanoarchaeota archaeon]